MVWRNALAVEAGGFQKMGVGGLLGHIRSTWYDDFMTGDTMRADTVWSTGG